LRTREKGSEELKSREELNQGEDLIRGEKKREEAQEELRRGGKR